MISSTIRAPRGKAAEGASTPSSAGVWPLQAARSKHAAW